MEEETAAKAMDVDAGDESLGVAVAVTAPDTAVIDGDPVSAAAAAGAADMSSSDSEDEAAQELRIGELEAALAGNPMNYDAHIQYINILRKLGHIEKLRLARESMNAYFPLSPKMWEEWTKDEASLSAGSEGFAQIEKLFERGVREYLSVPLWCDYLEFVEEHDPLVCQCAPDGLSRMRNLFESALTAGGLHITEGNKLWEAYKEFELAILLTIDDNNSEEKSKQAQRIRVLFHRQLSVPSVDLRSTLKAYKLWENEQGNANDPNTEMDGVPGHISSSYRKALEMYNARSVYEDQLSSCDRFHEDRLAYYMNYIKYEESAGDPARVQILYERALFDFPVTGSLWLEYTSYLDNTLKVPSVLKHVYSRATRNCMWVAELWVRYLLSLERIHASEWELNDVFERSIGCVFPSSKEYLDLFLTRIDGLRRRIYFVGPEDQLQYPLIRETFQRAVDYLYPQVTPHVLLDLHVYWARLEATLGKDLAAARGVWEGLIKRSGSLVEVWQSYVAMEIEMGNVNEARSIYKRCYNKRFSGTGSEDICHSWLLFERKYGTLEDLDLAVKKVTPRLKELMRFKGQQESRTVIPDSATMEKSVVNNPKKRKMTKSSSEKQAKSKKPKDVEHKSVGSSSLVPTQKTVNSSTLGVTDEVKDPTVAKAVVSGSSNVQQIGEPGSNESKPIIYTDECTAFITNLGYELTKEDLQEFFSDCGVTDVRILRDRDTGKSRGLAYADFSDDAHLALAIAKDGQKLNGKKLHIARSNPKQSKKNASAGSSTGGQGREVREKVRKLGNTGNMKVVGKTTFAVPRAVIRPLGWQNNKEKTNEDVGVPKSNDEFRNMLLRK